VCAKVLESVKGCRAVGVLIQREVRRSSSSCSQDWRSPIFRSRVPLTWLGDLSDQVVHRERSGKQSVSQGAGKSFWTLPISGRRWRWLTVLFVDDGSPFRVFAMKGIYRWRGNVREWPRGPHHLVACPRAGPRHPMVRLPPGPPLYLLWTPSSGQLNRNFGFHFVQFWEYFLCNFSETQK
jgi:hypothetical protein